MLLSPSTSPSPADSPAVISFPPAPLLFLPLPPFPAFLPPLSSPSPSQAPAPAVATPVVSSSPPTIQPPPPAESPPPPAASESQPFSSFPAKSPPLSPISAITPPPPPVTTTTSPPPPPVRPRVPWPSPPPLVNPSPPFSPKPSPPPTRRLPTTPFTSSFAPTPKNSPAAKFPFVGPIGPIPDKPRGPLMPSLGPTIGPKKSPGESAPPPAHLPLVPKSHPDTAPHHRPSASLLFGGVIIGVLLLVLLGLLFVCYRATRNRKDRFVKDSSHKPPKENAVLAGTHVISAPPPPYAPPPGTSIIGYSTRGNSSGSGSGSVHRVQARTAASPLNITLSPGKFSYDELSEATSGFSDANLLGQGGFGYVHKGVLKNGREVAVKQLKVGSHQGEREFQAEVDMISRVHHKHLVSLVGYCVNGDRRLLVYEFVPNSTLEFHLHGNGTCVLEWETRLKIAVGAAKGLAYLHEDCSPTIIHRDIKAANILIDPNFEAKVADFGLAKFFLDTNSSITHVSTRVVGTFGYMAPEYALSGKLTDRSDVYSFGVVLLELITGRLPIIAKDPSTNQSLVDWARPLLAKALEDGHSNVLIDPNLQGNYNTAQMGSMIACAAACIHESAWLRPRMSQIVRALEGEIPLAKFDKRGTPGQSTTIKNSSEISNNVLQLYITSRRRFNSGLTDEHTSNGRSGSTSEYGINPSLSSSEHQVTD